MEYFIEYKTHNARKLREISLDLVRRGQMIIPAFQKGSISTIPFNLVKTINGPMGAIHKKRKDLFIRCAAANPYCFLKS